VIVINLQHSIVPVVQLVTGGGGGGVLVRGTALAAANMTKNKTVKGVATRENIVNEDGVLGMLVASWLRFQL
jgi:hypothetical protein